jgi:hypothetical protein
MRFLTDHWIHRSGGIPFFAVAMGMFIPLVWALRRTEKSGTETDGKGVIVPKVPIVR